jgi:hypothetical protein
MREKFHQLLLDERKVRFAAKVQKGEEAKFAAPPPLDGGKIFLPPSAKCNFHGSF